MAIIICIIIMTIVSVFFGIQYSRLVKHKDPRKNVVTGANTKAKKKIISLFPEKTEDLLLEMFDLLYWTSLGDKARPLVAESNKAIWRNYKKPRSLYTRYKEGHNHRTNQQFFLYPFLFCCYENEKELVLSVSTLLKDPSFYAEGDDKIVKFFREKDLNSFKKFLLEDFYDHKETFESLEYIKRDSKTEMQAVHNFLKNYIEAYHKEKELQKEDRVSKSLKVLADNSHYFPDAQLLPCASHGCKSFCLAPIHEGLVTCDSCGKDMYLVEDKTLELLIPEEEYKFVFDETSEEIENEMENQLYFEFLK